MSHRRSTGFNSGLYGGRVKKPYFFKQPLMPFGQVKTSSVLTHNVLYLYACGRNLPQKLTTELRADTVGVKRLRPLFASIFHGSPSVAPLVSKTQPHYYLSLA